MILILTIFLSSHDWPTSECLTILTSIRKSMGPSSRLLIREWRRFFVSFFSYRLVFHVDELVLQHAVRDASVSNQVSVSTKSCDRQLAHTTVCIGS